MTADITIRRAGPPDAAALALVGSATMLETYAERVPGPDLVAHCANKHSSATYAAWLADPSVIIWIAETALLAAVGYLVLMPTTLPEKTREAGDLEVQRIYVLSRFHGSGVGHRLMRQAIDTARVAGARRLVLGVLKVNDRAVGFYTRQGFAVINARQFQVGASVFDDYVMGLLLDR